VISRASLYPQRQDLLREDPAFYQGRRNGQYVEHIPTLVSGDLILRGQERFNIYCAACHGYAGDGQGMVGVRWTAPVPSFHTAELKDPQSADGRGTDGYIFHVAMNGVIRPDGTPSMPPYSHALSARDAWAIVAYIRVLQESREVSLDQLPPDVRQRVMEQRLRMPGPGRPEVGPGQTVAPSTQVPFPGTPGATPPQITREQPIPQEPTPQPPRQNP
jgi:mono/diheme cytochrome c family protein